MRCGEASLPREVCEGDGLGEGEVLVQILEWVVVVGPDLNGGSVRARVRRDRANRQDQGGEADQEFPRHLLSQRWWW